MASLTSMDMSLSELQEMVKDREAWPFMGSQRVGQLNHWIITTR